jgi:hypothetical protein
MGPRDGAPEFLQHGFQILLGALLAVETHAVMQRNSAPAALSWRTKLSGGRPNFRSLQDFGSLLPVLSASSLSCDDPIVLGLAHPFRGGSLHRALCPSTGPR